MCQHESKKKLINDDFSDNFEDKKVVEEKIVCDINANVLWGKVIYKLRQNNLLALHTACGEIRNVKLADNCLNIYVVEEYLYNVLKREENFESIQRVLKTIDKNLILDIVKKEPVKNIEEETIKKLKKMFNDKFKIRD